MVHGRSTVLANVFGVWILALLLVTPLSAVRAGTPLPRIVLDALPAPRETFRVGITELRTRDAEAQVGVAAVTFPRLLYENLARVDERDLSPEELETYARLRLERALVTAAARLQAAVESRDRLLFDRSASDEQRAQRRATAASAVTTARELVDALEATDPRLVPAEAVRPIVFWEGHEEGRLVPIDGELEDIARAEDLDLVISGLVEEIEGYLAVDLVAYHRFLGSTVDLSGTIALPEEIGRDAPIVAQEAARVVLGRPYASLVVETPGTDAAIAINGDLEGFGRVSSPFLRPGVQEVVAQAEGYRTVRTTVALEAGDERTAVLDLEEAASRTVRIQSSPSGADVYADSVWVGTTPLERRFPAQSTIVRVRSEGYLESRFVVDPDSPEVVTRALLPDSIDWSQEILAQRDSFYDALTWFVVSLPVTVLLNGGYESVRGAFPPAGSDALSPSEELRLGRLGNILYWSSIGSTLVNVGLFANLVITILDYVEVGEGPHNQ